MRSEHVGLNVKNMQQNTSTDTIPNTNYHTMLEQSTKMTYEVQSWDDTNKCVNYYTVEDAIDYEDARDVIAQQYPEYKVIAVVKKA